MTTDATSPRAGAEASGGDRLDPELEAAHLLLSADRPGPAIVHLFNAGERAVVQLGEERGVNPARRPDESPHAANARLLSDLIERGIAPPNAAGLLDRLNLERKRVGYRGAHPTYSTSRARDEAALVADLVHRAAGLHPAAASQAPSPAQPPVEVAPEPRVARALRAALPYLCAVAAVPVLWVIGGPAPLLAVALAIAAAIFWMPFRIVACALLFAWVAWGVIGLTLELGL